MFKDDQTGFDHIDEQRSMLVDQGNTEVLKPRGCEGLQNCRIVSCSSMDHQVNISSVFDNTEIHGQIENDHGTVQCQDIDDLCEVLESFDMVKGQVKSKGCYCEKDINADEADSICKHVYTRDLDGDTLLHSAIITLNEQLAKQFANIAQSPRVLNVHNNLKQTPLHLAVLTQQPRVVRRLIVGGADILSRDRDGNTPLHIACREGYIEIVRTLLEPIRYPETKQNQYDIPYQRIPQDLNITNYDGLCCLHLAASSGHLDMVTVLIDKHANINGRDIKCGRTPLHNACVDGNLELVKLLLKYKDCNINARTYNNLTPFDLARDRGFSRITFELAAAGAMIANEIDMNEF